MGTGGWKSQSAAEANLQLSYRRAVGGYVAFLDESYELNSDRDTFYLLSAVVTHRDQLDTLRDGLLKVVGDSFWHTTERLRTSSGRKQVLEVAEYLGAEDGEEVCIVSYRAPVAEGGADAARAACFKHIASTLCGGDNQLENGVHLMVLEQRETMHERSFDDRIVKELRAAKVICRHCRLVQASPRHGNLLWLPDLVSSAVRQDVTRGDRTYLEPIAEIVSVINCP